MKRAAALQLTAALALVSATAARGWGAASACRYAVEVDTVLDRSTGLLWQRAVSASSLPWSDSRNYCQSLSLGGFSTGWRLPDREELRSLVDVRSSSPSIDSAAFPSTPAEGFWSATPYATAGAAWQVEFAGGAESSSDQSTPRRVRCVRSPMVNVSPPDMRKPEGVGVTVVLSLSAPRGVDVNVPYTLSGTASLGLDYSVVTPSPLVIPAGETSISISFKLVNDYTTEAEESVVLTLGSPVNALAGATISHTLTIVEPAPWHTLFGASCTRDIDCQVYYSGGACVGGLCCSNNSCRSNADCCGALRCLNAGGGYACY